MTALLVLVLTSSTPVTAGTPVPDGTLPGDAAAGPSADAVDDSGAMPRNVTAVSVPVPDTPTDAAPDEPPVAVAAHAWARAWSPDAPAAATAANVTWDARGSADSGSGIAVYRLTADEALPDAGPADLSALAEGPEARPPALHAAPGEVRVVEFQVVNHEDVPVTTFPRVSLVQAAPVPGADPRAPGDAVRWNATSAESLDVRVLDAAPVPVPAGGASVIRVSFAAPEDALPGWTFRYEVEAVAVAGNRVHRAVAEVGVVTVPPPEAPTLQGMVTAPWEDPPPLAWAAFLATSAGLAAAVTAARREDWRLFLLGPLVGLFTRLGKADLLTHETRERLHAFVHAHPGVHYSALREETGLAPGVLLHHLRVLEDHRLITSRREGTRRCYYAAGARVPARPERVLTTTQKRILRLLDGDGRTQRDLAERLGLTQQGVSYHLRGLQRRGFLVVYARVGARRYARAPGVPRDA